MDTMNQTNKIIIDLKSMIGKDTTLCNFNDLTLNNKESLTETSLISKFTQKKENKLDISKSFLSRKRKLADLKKDSKNINIDLSDEEEDEDNKIIDKNSFYDIINSNKEEFNLINLNGKNQKKDTIDIINNDKNKCTILNILNKSEELFENNSLEDINKINQTLNLNQSKKIDVMNIISRQKKIEDSAIFKIFEYVNECHITEKFCFIKNEEYKQVLKSVNFNKRETVKRIRYNKNLKNKAKMQYKTGKNYNVIYSEHIKEFSKCVNDSVLSNSSFTKSMLHMYNKYTANNNKIDKSFLDIINNDNKLILEKIDLFKKKKRFLKLQNMSLNKSFNLNLESISDFLTSIKCNLNENKLNIMKSKFLKKKLHSRILKMEANKSKAKYDLNSLNNLIPCKIETSIDSCQKSLFKKPLYPAFENSLLKCSIEVSKEKLNSLFKSKPESINAKLKSNIKDISKDESKYKSHNLNSKNLNESFKSDKLNNDFNKNSKYNNIIAEQVIINNNIILNCTSSNLFKDLKLSTLNVNKM